MTEKRESRDISRELMEAFKTYGGDRHQLLKDHIRVDYLYALSSQRESLVDWYPFRPEASLLEVGSDYGALTGVYARKVSQVDVLDESGENLAMNRLRHVETEGRNNVEYHQGGICLYAARCEKQYDYIVFVGSLGDNAEKQIQAAKRILKPGGEILVAACNPLGIKYWAGVPKDQYSFTKNALTSVLEGSGKEGKVKFCYPMPDYRLPVTIFSDEYLPVKGDLTDTVAAYDYPRYIGLDVGAKFDEVCEDGQFDRYANSYLAVWKDGGEEEGKRAVEYIKYNRTRRDRFQIRTVIWGKPRYVEKTALEEAGAVHIQAFEENSRRLNSQHKNLRFAPPEISGSRTAGFPYLVGRTLSEQLGQIILDGQAPVEAVRRAMAMVLDVREECRSPFEVTREFTEVFGQLPENRPDGWESLDISNIDALFENILLVGEEWFCLDYEWVFSFPIPMEYIRYRILFYFFRQYKSLLTGYKDADAWLEEFHITPEALEIYEAMERNFQKYVHGENQKIYLENYYGETKHVEEMAGMERELEMRQGRIEDLLLRLEEKDVAVSKITELQRLTQNHVNNLEAIIGNLRREIGEMSGTLAYLERHESKIFKVKRKLSDKLNEKYPVGSVGRKKLSYLKEYVRHPVRSALLYSREEGRNLREGDFAIGSVYKEHGRLHFPKVENPKVSVIIPVYNQIGRASCRERV